MTNQKLVSLLGLLVVLALFMAGFLWFNIPQNFTSNGQPVTASSGTPALIGGAFSLTDQTGTKVTDKTYLGNPMVVYFGYTFCPDICPAELQVISAALDEMGAKGADIQPIFVSIDPERDDVETMALYVSNFGSRFIGLTGTTAEIAQVAKAYRVYYAKAPEQEGESGYAMDHSSIIYLMGKDGKFIKHFTYGTDAKELATGITKALGR